MSCAGLCRCFTLTRANRIISYNSLSWQRGVRCTAPNKVLSNYVETDTNRYHCSQNPNLRRTYTSSASAVFNYSGHRLFTTEDWFAVAQLRRTRNQSCTVPPRLLSQGNPFQVRASWLHTSASHAKELAESDTKVESTVKHLKERKKEKEKEAKGMAHVIPGATPSTAPSQEVALPKKTIMQRVKDEVMHYWHGFRLLGVDMKVAAKLLWRVLNGKTLTRREYRQFTRTVADIFRLVPFLVFILIPFMEFLLPVAVKLFPGMLPSTFELKSKKEEKLKKELKLKLEMAKFLQDSIEETPLVNKLKTKDAERAQEFANFIVKIRTSGVQASNEEITKFSKLFENELTLDNLSRDQLIALCRLLRLKPFGTNNFLRFQLRMQLRNLMLDDKMIDKEGVDTLTVGELQVACQARGMRAIGVPVERLTSQLQQWLDLHLHEQIPTSLLLLSRALYLPENLAVPEQLKVTIASLPEKTASEAKIKLSEVAGEKVSNTERLALIKEEEEVINKEREERRAEEREERETKRAETEVETEAEVLPEEIAELKAQVAEEIAAAKETMIDTAPIIEQDPLILQFVKKPEIVEDVTKEDISELKEAIGQIVHEKDELLKEREQMEELKEDIEEYKEDLEHVRKEAEVFEEASQLQESKSSARLSKRVNRLLGRIDNIVDELETKKEGLEKEEVTMATSLRISLEGMKEDRDDGKEKEMEDAIDSMRNDIVSVEELMNSITKLTKITDEAKLKNILHEMDVNEDGHIDIGEVIKALETISKEKINLNTKQIGDIMDILYKEEEVEEMEEMEHALEKEELVGQRLPPATHDDKKTDEIKQ